MAASDKRGFRPVNEVAELFDVSTQAFHKTYRPLVKPEDVREDGRQTLIRVRGLVDAWTAHRVRAEQIAAGVDPDMGGGDSPNLERYRHWKANQEQLKYEAMKGNLIPREEALKSLIQFTETLKRATDALVSSFGSGAGQILEKACNEAEEDLKKRLTPETNEPGDTDAAAGGSAAHTTAEGSNDKGVRGKRNRSAKRPAKGHKVPGRHKSVRRPVV